MTDLVKRLTRFKRWRDSDGNQTGAMVADEDGGWVRYGPAADRIKELEADRDDLAVKNYDQAKRIKELQRKHEALVDEASKLMRYDIENGDPQMGGGFSHFTIHARPKRGKWIRADELERALENTLTPENGDK